MKDAGHHFSFRAIMLRTESARAIHSMEPSKSCKAREGKGMPQIKGPALFLAQFVQDVPPYNTLENITAWAKEMGFTGVQIPASDSHMIDLDKAAESKQYCDDLKGQCNGLEITELAAH